LHSAVATSSAGPLFFPPRASSAVSAGDARATAYSPALSHTSAVVPVFAVWTCKCRLLWHNAVKCLTRLEVPLRDRSTDEPVAGASTSTAEAFAPTQLEEQPPHASMCKRRRDSGFYDM
jgi:hypothetical protein